MERESGGWEDGGGQERRETETRKETESEKCIVTLVGGRCEAFFFFDSPPASE